MAGAGLKLIIMDLQGRLHLAYEKSQTWRGLKIKLYHNDWGVI